MGTDKGEVQIWDANKNKKWVMRSAGCNCAVRRFAVLCFAAIALHSVWACVRRGW